MTPWDMLVNASKLPGATAWQQLEAIQTNRVIIYTEIEASIMPEVSAELESKEIEATVQAELSAVIEPEIGSELE